MLDVASGVGRLKSWSAACNIARVMEIVYAAHTESGVFMLDEQGVCRWAVANPGKTRERVPERIVGAQYVATLDLEATGGLVVFPRVGCPMLFAATDETGRIKLVRTPKLLRFEDRRSAPTRQPLASKLDTHDIEDLTPITPTPIPPRPTASEVEAFPLLRPPSRTPLPPPPQARIAARIPPVSFPSPGIRTTTGVQSIPVRIRATNMSLRKLARGQ